MARASSRRRERRRAPVARPEIDPFRLAFEQAPVGIAIHDPVGEIVLVNQAMRDLLGCDNVDLAAFVNTVHPDERNALHCRLRSLIAGETSDWVAEHRLVQADGTSRRVRLHVTVTHDLSGEIASLMTHAVDVTAHGERAQALLHQTLHDALTGLPNRTLLCDRLGHALSRSTRVDGATVALLFLDLDHFKLVNDSLGHATGDAVLTEAAARLRATVRPSDTVARFGGDEFVVCCEDVRSGTETIAMAERILRTMRDPFIAAVRSSASRRASASRSPLARTRRPRLCCATRTPRSTSRRATGATASRSTTTGSAASCSPGSRPRPSCAGRSTPVSCASTSSRRSRSRTTRSSRSRRCCAGSIRSAGCSFRTRSSRSPGR